MSRICVCLLLLLLYLQVTSIRSENPSSLTSVQAQQQHSPAFASCHQRYKDSSFKITCRAGKHQEECKGGMEQTRSTWLVRCLADAMIGEGFQVPVYVVHGSDIFRLNRIKQELAVSGVHHAHIHNRFQSQSLNETDAKSFYLPTKATGDPNDEAYKACMDIYSATKTEKDPHKKCSQGIQLDNRVIAVGLEHYHILKAIAECQDGYPNCASLSSDQTSRFALVFEDDQHIPTNILQLIAMLLIKSSMSPDLVMLDDSWFWLDQFFPPPEYMDKDTLSSYPRNYTRTVGAYLINQYSARKLVFSKSFYPQRLPIDLQMNYAILKEKINTQWAFPPLTCAGSAGMNETSSTGGYSIWPEFRDNCKICCNKFYDVDTMRSYLTLLPLTSNSSQAKPVQIDVMRNEKEGGEGGNSSLANYEGEAVKSMTGKPSTIFYVENGKLRAIPNMDTFYATLHLKVREIVYLKQDQIELGEKGPDVPPCTNC